MTNSVQGVQGSVQGSVQGLSPCCAWFVQGVQGSPLRAHRRAKNIHPLLYFSPRAYRPPLHTLHTLHTQCHSWAASVQGVFSRLHTLHTTIFFKKIMKEKSLIICGPDNVKEFNKRLKERAPEFFLLAKALHKAGMIDGLGGAIIQTKPSAQEITEKSQQHAVTSEKMKVCGHCQQFKRDSVGDGTGIGGCLSCVSTRRAKYPGHDACDLFQVII